MHINVKIWFMIFLDSMYVNYTKTYIDPGPGLSQNYSHRNRRIGTLVNPHPLVLTMVARSMTWQVGRCPGDPSMVESFVVNYLGKYIRSTTHQSILWQKKREQKKGPKNSRLFFHSTGESLMFFWGLSSANIPLNMQ